MSRLKLALANVVLALASFVALYPVLWVVKMALQPGQAFDASPNPFPDSVSLEHFAAVIGQIDARGRWLFGHQLFNSLAVSIATTIVGLVLATTAAYAFSRFRFEGREGLLDALLLTQIFPGVVVMIPLYVLLDALGLLDSLAGLVLVYATTSIPFCTFQLKGYLDTIPKELEEAAVLDGATPGVIFLKIVLPLARPALAVTALFAFMTAWNEYVLAYTFLNDEASFTLPVALKRHVGDYSADWGSFAAGAILTSAPVMALFFALQKHLVGGLTSGGVKG